MGGPCAGGWCRRRGGRLKTGCFADPVETSLAAGSMDQTDVWGPRSLHSRCQRLIPEDRWQSIYNQGSTLRKILIPTKVFFRNTLWGNLCMVSLLPRWRPVLAPFSSTFVRRSFLRIPTPLAIFPCTLRKMTEEIQKIW